MCLGDRTYFLLLHHALEICLYQKDCPNTNKDAPLCFHSFLHLITYLPALCLPTLLPTYPTSPILHIFPLQAVRTSIYGRPGPCYIDMTGDMIVGKVNEEKVRSVIFHIFWVYFLVIGCRRLQSVFYFLPCLSTCLYTVLRLKSLA